MGQQPGGRDSNADLTDCPVYKIESSVSRHAEQALATAGVSPCVANLALGFFRVEKMRALVFDNQDSPIVEHRYKIRIELSVW